jgi:hypothetical protein
MAPAVAETAAFGSIVRDLACRGRSKFHGAGMSLSFGSPLRQARSIRIAPTPSIIE